MAYAFNDDKSKFDFSKNPLPLTMGGTMSTTPKGARQNLGFNAMSNRATVNSSYFPGGTVKYIKYGSIVIVTVQDLVISQTLTDGVTVATGLPTAREMVISPLIRWADGKTMRVKIDGGSGTLQVHYSYDAASSNQYYGQFIYAVAASADN